MADGEGGEKGKEQRNRKEEEEGGKADQKKPDGEKEVWSSEGGHCFATPEGPQDDTFITA